MISIDAIHRGGTRDCFVLDCQALANRLGIQVITLYWAEPRDANSIPELLTFTPFGFFTITAINHSQSIGDVLRVQMIRGRTDRARVVDIYSQNSYLVRKIGFWEWFRATYIKRSTKWQ